VLHQLRQGLVLRKLFKGTSSDISMLTNKNIRSRGKMSLTKYFQEFKEGDSVAIVRDLTVQRPGFPSRIQGRTGVVAGKRGESYVVLIKDFIREKVNIVKPIHLKKIEVTKK
jgi:ribosomal protein L21E